MDWSPVAICPISTSMKRLRAKRCKRGDVKIPVAEFVDRTAEEWFRQEVLWALDSSNPSNLICVNDSVVAGVLRVGDCFIWMTEPMKPAKPGRKKFRDQR
jgi:hypothetical protein